MTETTPLDAAHGAMASAPENDAARVAFYDCLADVELVLLLAEEAGADRVKPALVEAGGAQYLVAFDTEARLAAFAGTVAPYAALSGRGLVDMLAGQQMGIALNPDVAPSAMLIPHEAVDWLAATLANAPREAQARVVEVGPPGALPAALMAALGRKLRGAGALAAAAWLVSVRYEGGARGHLLAFVDALPDAQPGLAVAAGEALTFSGVEAGSMDVTFVQAAAPMAARLERVGLRVDLPRPTEPEGPRPPGMDPERPPKLR